MTQHGGEKMRLFCRYRRLVILSILREEKEEESLVLVAVIIGGNGKMQTACLLLQDCRTSILDVIIG